MVARFSDRRRFLFRHVIALLCVALVAALVAVFALAMLPAGPEVAAAAEGGAGAPQGGGYAEPQVSISGQFRDFTTGRPIGGARITIRSQDGISAGRVLATAVADAAGEFALTAGVATGVQLTAVYEAAGYLREESVMRATEPLLKLSPLLTPRGVKEAVLYSLPKSGLVRQPIATVSTALAANYSLVASTLSPPATIRVYRNSLGIVQVVDFKFYVKHVLVCEWLPQWPAESLRAGAIAVKEYAWYYIGRGGKYPSLGADVTDGSADQWYDPNRSDARTDKAVDDTWSSYLLKNGALFFLEYCGHSALNAAYRCPSQPTRMPQWGTYYLARDKGWTWQQIIHYYWDPVTIVGESASGSTRIQQNDTRLAYYRTWLGNANAPLASGGSFRYVNTSGASVTVKFTGTYVAWITKKSSVYGKARVTLDGVDKGTVDLYSAKEIWQQRVWETSFATSGTHTLTITWTGTKNPAAAATNIGVDAFVVTGTVLQATAVAPAPAPAPAPAGRIDRYQQNFWRVAYRGTWYGNANAPLASGGSFRYVNTSGASVTVKFTGTYIAWITKKSPYYGRAKVILDGVNLGTVDLYSAKEVWQQKVWSKTFATSGAHTLVISWTGQKNPLAKATNIGADAFDVIGRLTGP